jgi:hypothetical protein
VENFCNLYTDYLIITTTYATATGNAKPYTDESELICWHWDHVFQRSVKGVNFLTAIAEVQGMRLPCAVEFVRKDQWEINTKTGKGKGKSSKTKNELFRGMLTQCWQNFMFDYVACDSWF